MKPSFHPAGRMLCTMLLGLLLMVSPLAAQAAPSAQSGSTKLVLEVTEMGLEITADDPRPKAYLYTGGQSDYYFIIWMSNNPSVATVDGDGKVTARKEGNAIITAVSDHGDRAACKVTVTRKGTEAEAQKPALSETNLNLTQQYNDLHPAKQLQLLNSDRSFIYIYQWRSSDPAIASVDETGLVTAQNPGTATITAFASNGQALRCAVTVTSDVGKVTLNKTDLLLRTVGSREALSVSVAMEGGASVPITWVSSNPGVATVDTNGVVTAVADGEAKITALSPTGKFAVCCVVVGLAGEKYTTEEDLSDELKLPNPYVAVRLNRLA